MNTEFHNIPGWKFPKKSSVEHELWPNYRLINSVTVEVHLINLCLTFMSNVSIEGTKLKGYQSTKYKQLSKLIEFNK